MEILQVILDACEEKMTKAIDALEKEMGLIRTGRANPKVLSGVMVSYYGMSTPLEQIASISTPEAQQLLIKPYDVSSLKDIEKAIQTADLNLNPISDGKVLRVNFPPLTEETRKMHVRELNNLLESYKIQMRNFRREANDEVKKMENDKEISEDASHSYQDEIQKLTDKYIKLIEDKGKKKELDILEI
ncbi:MAG TPA: ribosome recycling factor [Acholeplasma sp.]|jgi:ribosome recycling factor|nr:ribosome recycling factor [Acholeplasma sp.]